MHIESDRNSASTVSGGMGENHTRLSAEAPRCEDLQAVERMLPDCDWFEREEVRDARDRSAPSRWMGGRMVELEF